jgi:Uma2 family endonuclease
MFSRAKSIDESELDMYPSGDDQPMAETQIHVRAIMLLHQALEDFFAMRNEDVLVSSDIFWYWERGNVKARISPDVMAVPGAKRRDIYETRSYFSWIEGIIPAVVFEMASRKTWKKDLGPKFEKYQSLGVKEYFIFDPEFRYLDDPLIGFRLRGKKYVELRPDNLESRLGFRLEKEEYMIRLTDLESGEPVLTRSEAIENARAQTDLANQRADKLAEELSRLKKELGRS